MSALEGVPSLDLHDFLSGNEVLKATFVKNIGEAYERIGFVSIKNHGVSEELIEELYNNVTDFFALPETVKAKYIVPGIAGQRGYTPFGKEHAKGSNVGDLKEFWHFGQFFNEGVDGNLENVSVKELPDFLKTGQKAYQALEHTGKTILRAIAMYLELEPTFFDGYVNGGNSILRPIHYPPITGTPAPGAVRAGEHEDINLITLLIGASASGLQVLNKQQEWIDVTAIEGHIIVNVGDMLQRLTNNKLRSTTHRVVNPPKELWVTSRYSIPFFLHPVADMPLNCLPECVDQAHSKHYEDITAGEYLMQRLKEIGLV